VAATASVKIIKQFNFLGQVRLVSNRYHIGTAYPPDGTHWATLCDAIVAAEAPVTPTLANFGTKIVEAVGYAPGSEVPVFTKAYTTDGSLSIASTSATPGDTVALVRYSTPDRSTKNHPVYCFNYYHGARYLTSGSTPDTLATGQATALSTYAALWIAGFSDGTTTYHRSRPTGDLCNGYVVHPLLTYRDLAR
jgi:hypothetical protein